MSSSPLVQEFRQFVIQPVLLDMARVTGLPQMAGEGAEELLLGIALHESEGLLYARQVSGPAIGPYQMEGATYQDLFKNFLAFQSKIKESVLNFSSGSCLAPEEMAFNWYYATAVARAQLYRFPAALPAAGDLAGQASWYKKFWNTPLGAATPEQYVAHWNQYA